MNLHVMIDLETVDTKPTAAFQQLGYCLFDLDPDNPRTVDSGCAFVDVQSCLDIGLTLDWETIRWWLGQAERLRLLEQGLPVQRILRDFEERIPWAQVGGVWSHGANFDIPILENAYKVLGLQVPWSYKINRDTRTLFWLSKPEWPTNPHIHNAETDARCQALAVIDAYTRLCGGGRSTEGQPAA